MPFLDIFSPSRKEKPKEKPKILVDHREKASQVPKILSESLELEFKQLPVGDYIIENTAIERKTLSDLKSSIINKRIIQQLLELKQYPNHLLILEGFPTKDSNKSNFNRGFNPNALKGFLLSTALDFKVPIIFTENPQDTANYLKILANKTKKESPIRASKIFKSKSQQVQHILEGFPNIGPKKIKSLLKKFKSLKNIINAEDKSLKPILGKRTSQFIELINNR